MWGQCPGLAGYLARVPGPRNRRGVRHSLTSLLTAAVAEVLAGATSSAAVGGWVADAPPQVLAAPGVRRDPLTRRFVPPDTDTTRLHRGPGGCCAPLPYRHRLALAEGEAAGVACARSGDPRGHQGLEGIGPQAIGTAGEVPLLEVCACGVVHDR